MLVQLYRHYNSKDELLYVGVAADAMSRLRRHPFSGDVAYSKIEVFRSKDAALRAETKAIKTEQPKFNSAHLPPEQKRAKLSMSSGEYVKALEALGLNQSSAARWMDISVRSSNSYANGAMIPEAIAKLLRVVVKYGEKPMA